jgi:hypothetical protein
MKIALLFVISLKKLKPAVPPTLNAKRHLGYSYCFEANLNQLQENSR